MQFMVKQSRMEIEILDPSGPPKPEIGPPMPFWGPFAKIVFNHLSPVQ